MRGWKQQRIQEWLDRLTRVHTEERTEALLDAWSKVLILEGKLK